MEHRSLERKKERKKENKEVNKHILTGKKERKNVILIFLIWEKERIKK